MSGAALVVGIAVAGGLGAAARFVLDGALRARAGQRPVSPTLVVNVLGSGALGALTAAHLGHGLPMAAYLVAGVGFCGGFTTFSTAMAEAVRLLQTGHVRRAGLELLMSLVVCVLAAAAGFGLVLLGSPGAVA